jgi:hypothetical protein
LPGSIGAIGPTTTAYLDQPPALANGPEMWLTAVQQSPWFRGRQEQQMRDRSFDVVSDRTLPAGSGESDVSDPVSGLRLG